jgi:hypothetical protein
MLLYGGGACRLLHKCSCSYYADDSCANCLVLCMCVVAVMLLYCLRPFATGLRRCRAPVSKGSLPRRVESC